MAIEIKIRRVMFPILCQYNMELEFQPMGFLKFRFWPSLSENRDIGSFRHVFSLKFCTFVENATGISVLKVSTPTKFTVKFVIRNISENW